MSAWQRSATATSISELEPLAADGGAALASAGDDGSGAPSTHG